MSIDVGVNSYQNRTVNVTGEILVLNKIFPGLLLSKFLLYADTNSIFPSFSDQFWENPCFMLGKFLFSTRVSPVTFTVRITDAGGWHVCVLMCSPLSVGAKQGFLYQEMGREV